MRNNTHISQIPQDIDQKIEITNIPVFDIVDYNLSDEKQLKKYLFDVERTCRNSFVYKKLIAFLREHIDMNKCSFFENVNNIESNSIHIHIHHSPLTLFDIVTIVYHKRLDNREPLNVNLVAKEVMLLHYLMLIGLIPLSETVHELVHNGYLFIPTNVVFGDYKKFIKQYEDYIDQQLLNTLEQAEEYTKTYDYEKNTKVLSHSAIYVDASGNGEYKFPILGELISKIKELDN